MKKNLTRTQSFPIHARTLRGLHEKDAPRALCDRELIAATGGAIQNAVQNETP
jgi:hypothetical protein